MYLAVPALLTLTFVGVPENMQRVIANVRLPACLRSSARQIDLATAACVCRLPARRSAATNGGGAARAEAEAVSGTTDLAAGGALMDCWLGRQVMAFAPHHRHAQCKSSEAPSVQSKPLVQRVRSTLLRASRISTSLCSQRVETPLYPTAGRR